MAGKRSTPQHARSRSRVFSWVKRVLVVMLILANLTVFGALLMLDYVTGKVEAAVPRDVEVVEELSEAPTETLDPRTFLVIGSDSRENLPEDFGDFGDFGGQRADVIMLIQLFPDRGGAQILSIPRDLEADIEGHGIQKINAAYAYGEAPLMVKTVRDTLGVPIHNYVEVDFVGFASIVDELGGVDLAFPNPARDTKSGLAVEGGTQVLDGKTALAYARSRSYQELRNGSWVSVDASDIGRTRRQQQLMLAILAKLKRPSTVTDAGAVIDAIGRHLTMDAGLAEEDMVKLAWAMRGLSAADIEAATLPTVGANRKGQSFQVLDQPAATAMLSAFVAGRPLTSDPPGPIRVSVLNGNGQSGIATRWADALRTRGFEVVDVGDADSFDYKATSIVTRPDLTEAARTITTALGFGQVSTGALPEGVDVVVILGTDALG